MKLIQPFNKLPSFPKNIKDLNQISLAMIPLEPTTNCPAFFDASYRKRRQAIGQLSKKHIMGEMIHQIQYKPEEHQLWARIFKRLEPEHQQAMVLPYLKNIKFMKKQFNIDLCIPKINDLSDYLKKSTGFQIKPVPGIISQRSFLNCLAFKVFCSSQFIRHSLTENFAPEPDIIHEYIGHIPMFANQQIATISQEIGLMSLGASDEDLKRLGNAYLRTLQFGLCSENGQIKAYGAGIAACYQDLKRVNSKEYSSKELQSQVEQDLLFDYTAQQTRYWMSESLSEVLLTLRKFEKEFSKNYISRYDEKSQQISVNPII